MAFAQLSKYIEFRPGVPGIYFHSKDIEEVFEGIKVSPENKAEVIETMAVKIGELEKTLHKKGIVQNIIDIEAKVTKNKDLKHKIDTLASGLLEIIVNILETGHQSKVEGIIAVTKKVKGIFDILKATGVKADVLTINHLKNQVVIDQLVKALHENVEALAKGIEVVHITIHGLSSHAAVGLNIYGKKESAYLLREREDALGKAIALAYNPFMDLILNTAGVEITPFKDAFGVKQTFENLKSI